MTPTHLLAPIGILWKTIESYGHDPAAVFDRVGLTHEMFLKQGARIQHQTLNRLWDEATALVKDPCLGLRGAEFWHPSHFHALGYAWLASSTLREALTRLNRYFQMIFQNIEMCLDDTDEGLTFTLADSLQHPIRLDLSMATIMAMCRINFGPHLKPAAVRFIHPEPFCGDKYFAFFRGPVYFDAATDSLTLNKKDVDKVLPGGNPHLAEINDRIIKTKIQAPADNAAGFVNTGDQINRK